MGNEAPKINPAEDKVELHLREATLVQAKSALPEQPWSDHSAPAAVHLWLQRIFWGLLIFGVFYGFGAVFAMLILSR